MLQTGTELKRGYQIERVLGQGGMGAVYLARQSSLGRLVAIKETLVRLDDPAARAAALASFQREAEILASLDHPGLVGVKDYFEEAGSHFLVMSYIDGATLADIVSQAKGTLPVGQVLEWIDQVCDVLQFLHEHRPPVLVRDLKPANIMVDARGRIKLIDFGIARQHDGEHTATFLKGAGTVGFAPIEQFGATSTDERSDIYALGATMYCLLTGKVPPWSMQMATGEVCLQPPSSLNPWIPPVVESIILKSMALRRDDRYQSVALLRKALLGAAEGIPEGPRVPTEDIGARFCTHCGVTLLPSVWVCQACGTERGADTGARPPSHGPAPAADSGGSAPFFKTSNQASRAPDGMPRGAAAAPRRFAPVLYLLFAVGVAFAGVFALRSPDGPRVVASGTVEQAPVPPSPGARAVRIGVELKTPSVFDRRRLRLVGEGGVLVMRVDPSGPAARAQVYPMDVILTVDGVSVRTVDEVQRAVQRHRQGDTLSLDLWTRGASRLVTVTAE